MVGKTPCWISRTQEAQLVFSWPLNIFQKLDLISMVILCSLHIQSDNDFWVFLFVFFFFCYCLARSYVGSLCGNFRCLYCDQFYFNYFWMPFCWNYLLRPQSLLYTIGIHWHWPLISFHPHVSTAAWLQERRFQLEYKCWPKTGLDKAFFNMKLLSCWSKFPAGKY